MIYPPIEEVMDRDGNAYALVIAVAKRAREIAQNAERDKIILIEKPVTLAVEDIAKKRYVYREPDHMRGLD